METLETNENASEPVKLTEEITGFLLETSKWTKFLSVLGFVGIALLVLIGGGISLLGSSLPTVPNFPMKFGFIGFIYVLLALLYFFPTYYLYKFSINLKNGLEDDDQSVFTSAFGYLKSTFKFMGVLAIVLISIYVLVIIGAVIGFSILAHR